MTSSPVPPEHVQVHARIARGMMEAEPDDSPSSYVIARLAEHVGLADLWSELAGRPYLLDALNPDAVAASILRTVYGRADLPAEIAASLSARHLLNRLDPQDRLMTRWLAAACSTGRNRDAPAWALIKDREPAHVVLTGHDGPVIAVATLLGREGPGVASAGTDGTIRIWDPLTGRPARSDIHVGEFRVVAVAGLRADDGGLLAGLGDDGDLRVWDWRSGSLVAASGGAPRAERGLLARLDDSAEGDLLCSGSVRGQLTLRRQRPEGLIEAGTLTVPGGLRAIAGLPYGDGGGLLTGGDDGRVRLYGSDAREIASVVVGGGGVSALQVADWTGGPAAIQVLTDSGRVTPLVLGPGGLQRAEANVLETGDGGRPIALVADAAAGTAVLTAADGDGLIRVWRRAGAEWRTAATMAGHTGAVFALVPIATTDGRRILVSAGADRTIRLWHPEANPVDELAGLERITATAATSGGGVAVGTDTGSVRLMNARTGRVEDGIRIESSRAVHAIAEVDDPVEGPILATGGAERGVRMWNLRTGGSITDRMNRHQSTVRHLVAYRNHSGAHRVASGGDDGVVRLWDPVTGRRAGRTPLTGHVGAVRHLVAATAGSAPVLIAGGGSETVLVWRETAPDAHELSRWSLLSPLSGLISLGEGRVILACAGGEIEIRDTAGEVVLLRRLALADPMVSAALVRAAGGDLLACGTSAGAIRLVDLTTGAIVRTTLLPMGLVAREIRFVSGRLLARTDRGLLGWALDPRIASGQLARSVRFQRGSLGP